MSRQPLVNRIIARHAGLNRVDAGQMVAVDVDRVYVQDGNSPTIARLFRQHGLSKVFDPTRIGFFFDHSVIVPDRQMADRVKEAMTFARELGICVFERGKGISHLIALESGWFEPGNIVLGADSHTCTGGAVQSLSLGMGASDVTAAMISGKTWLRVPETIWISVEGTPHPSLRPKDVVLALLRRYGQKPFLYKSIEWTGPWVDALSLDAAASLASMGVELGAKCVFLPDGEGRPAGMAPIEVLDPAKKMVLSLDELRPMVALPHSPDNCEEIDKVAGLAIDYVFVGSCTNSRLEDIAEVARILDGKKVHERIHCVVTPGSQSVYLDAMRLGYLEALTRAGALVTPPGCGACVGTQGTIPADGDRVLSTMNRNFKGRMGNPNAEIYLSTPLVAAHAALIGHIPHLSELDANAG